MRAELTVIRFIAVARVRLHCVLRAKAKTWQLQRTRACGFGPAMSRLRRPARTDLRNATWAVKDVAYHHGPSPVTLISLVLASGETLDWTIVCRSEIMRECGRFGLGLYTARALRQDDEVGLYEGEVIGTFGSFEAAMVSAEARQLLLRGHDKLVTRLLPGGRVELVDGQHGGGARLHMVNDAVGTALAANVALKPSGFVVVLHNHIPAFDWDQDLGWNARSELSCDYGYGYWAASNAVGLSPEFAYDLSG